MSIEHRTHHIGAPETEPSSDRRDDDTPRNWRRRLGIGVAAITLFVGGIVGASELTSDKQNVEAKGPPTTASGPPTAGGEVAPSRNPEAITKATLEDVKAFNLYDGKQVELTGFKEVAAQAKVPGDAASTSIEAAKYLFENGIPRLINTGANMATQRLYDNTTNAPGVESSYSEHTKLFKEIDLPLAATSCLFRPLDRDNNPQDHSLVQDVAGLAEFIEDINADASKKSEVAFTDPNGHKPGITEANMVVKPLSIEVNETAGAITTTYPYGEGTKTATFAIGMDKIGDEWKISTLKKVPEN